MDIYGTYMDIYGTHLRGHRQDISLRLVRYPNVLLMCF